MDSLTGKFFTMVAFLCPFTNALVTYLFLSHSKIQKYSPTESAKVYDKAVNRKNNIHFYPRQTLDFIANNMAHASLTNDIKRHIVRQYLDVSYKNATIFALTLFCICFVSHCVFFPPFTQFKVLMEHLDPDEEDEEGEASVSANIRNKAINALLGGSGPLLGPSPRNQAGPETDDDDSEGDERTPGVRCFQSLFFLLFLTKKGQCF